MGERRACCADAASRRAKGMAIKVALAGTSYFSQFHLDGWSRLPEVEVVAVCSLDLAGWWAPQRAI
jgi:hypothetical protein